MANDTEYVESIARYRTALEDALETANDAYKAPELTVMTSKAVMNACWDMQIEYSAMMRNSKREV